MKLTHWKKKERKRLRKVKLGDLVIWVVFWISSKQFRLERERTKKESSSLWRSLKPLWKRRHRGEVEPRKPLSKNWPTSSKRESRDYYEVLVCVCLFLKKDGICFLSLFKIVFRGFTSLFPSSLESGLRDPLRLPGLEAGFSSCRERKTNIWLGAFLSKALTHRNQHNSLNTA